MTSAHSLPRNTAMICDNCKGTELVRDTRDFSLGTVNGTANTIHGLTGDYCEHCGEVHFDIDAVLTQGAEKTWPGRRAPGAWVAAA